MKRPVIKISPPTPEDEIAAALMRVLLERDASHATVDLNLFGTDEKPHDFIMHNVRWSEQGTLEKALEGKE